MGARREVLSAVAERYWWAWRVAGPNEAMRESSRFFEAEDMWRHWSQVPAGYMIGLTLASPLTSTFVTRRWGRAKQ